MASQKKPLKVWLLLLAFMILVMISLGGITRLTGSGLSIVEWNLIMGAIPPLSLEDWNEAFLKYQNYPQFRLLNQSMALDDFKLIFFWEYLHRLWGRIMGFVFFIPLLYFWIKKLIPENLKTRLLFILALGGFQGLMGWFMVKSGLVDIPSVSHFRLAAHFTLALSLLGLVYWTYLDLHDHKKFQLPRFFNTYILVFNLQLTWGAFTAGLKAGHGYNTFPKMNGEWLPDHLFLLSPLYKNFLMHAPAVQFVHRLFGWSLFFFAIYFLSFSLKKPFSKIICLLSVSLLIQFLLGVSTLLFYVPLALATLHQLTASLILCLSIKVLHSRK